MVGCTIQHSRDPHPQNIFIIIQWAVACISIRLVRHILPVIPYLDKFLSSPMLGLISLNHTCGRPINSTSGSLMTNWGIHKDQFHLVSYEKMLYLLFSLSRNVSLKCNLFCNTTSFFVTLPLTKKNMVTSMWKLSSLYLNLVLIFKFKMIYRLFVSYNIKGPGLNWVKKSSYHYC